MTNRSSIRILSTAAVALTAAALLIATGGAPGVQPATKDAAPVTKKDVNLSDLAFLAGAWAGTMPGADGAGPNHVEELWSRPEGGAGGSIMGVFRWHKPAGDPMMFEILTITKESGNILLRLRHHSAKLEAWEEKGDPMELRLTTLDGAKVRFEGGEKSHDLKACTYTVTGDKLNIIVEFQDAARSPLTFDLTRRK